MPLTELDIEKYKSASSIFEGAKAKIETRVDEVIKIICKIFGSIPSSIPTPYYKDGSDEVEFRLTARGGRCTETDEWDYSYSFPRQFLFMSDDEIRSTIKKEIQDTEDNAKKEKEKRLTKAEAKKKLKAAVMKKLTKEEKKALGVKGG